MELENENLTTKNFELNKENMNITSELTKIKLELYNSNKITNYVSNDETLSNNTSQITQNRNMNLASVVTYQRQLEQRHNEGNIIDNEPDMIASFDDVSPECRRKKETENGSCFTGQISGNDDTSSEFEYSSKQNDSIIFNGGNKKRPPNSTIESITSSEFRKEVDKKENNQTNEENYNGNNTQSHGKEMQSFVSITGGDDINIIKNNIGQPIYNPNTNDYRPADYKDIVVSCRKLTGLSDYIAQIFSANNIPFYIERSGNLLDTIEIQILMNLIDLANN